MPYGWLFTLHICSDVAILPTSLTCPQSPLLDFFLPTFNFFSSLITVQHTDLLECCLGSSPLEARLYQTGDLRLCLWLSLTATTIPRMLQSLGKELILASRRFHWRHIVPISHTASHFSLPYDFQGYYPPCSYIVSATFICIPFLPFSWDSVFGARAFPGCLGILVIYAKDSPIGRSATASFSWVWCPQAQDMSESLSSDSILGAICEMRLRDSPVFWCLKGALVVLSLLSFFLVSFFICLSHPSAEKMPGPSHSSGRWNASFCHLQTLSFFTFLKELPLVCLLPKAIPASCMLSWALWLCLSLWLYLRFGTTLPFQGSGQQI